MNGKQLELTAFPLREASDFREMLIAGVKDFDSKIPPESAETVVDAAIAKGIVQPPAEDDFKWNDPQGVLLQEQRATAIYRNSMGGIVIRQERGWDEEDDSYVIIAPENEQAFLDKLCDVIGVPTFGGPQNG